MSDFVKDDGRTHIKSGLMRESLVSKSLIEKTDAVTVQRMVCGQLAQTVGAGR